MVLKYFLSVFYLCIMQTESFESRQLNYDHFWGRERDAFQEEQFLQKKLKLMMLGILSPKSHRLLQTTIVQQVSVLSTHNSSKRGGCYGVVQVTAAKSYSTQRTTSSRQFPDSRLWDWDQPTTSRTTPTPCPTALESLVAVFFFLIKMKTSIVLLLE